MIDFTGVKAITIPEGDVKQITRKSDGAVLWKAITFTNQVPISTDTDGSIFNGTGYIENRRLSSSGGLSGSAQNGSVTTGFIPFPNGDATIIRIKGVEFLNAHANHDGHYYLYFYDAQKAKYGDYHYLRSGDTASVSHIATITRDANGVETIAFNQQYGDTNMLLNGVRNQAKYFRITAYGKGADMIVTINEEIT